MKPATDKNPIDPFFSKNTGAKLENVLLLELIKHHKGVIFN